MKNILIPIDGSEYSKRAIEKAKEIAKAYDSNITLLNVVDNFIPNLNLNETLEILDQLKKQSKQLLDSTKKSFDDSYKVELISLEGNIANTITDYADNNNIDLVVMGSQGISASKIRGFFIGSIANKVIHSTKKPVLIIK